MSKTTAPTTPEEISDALAQFEADKMTRRRALKKFGITTGMAVFGMFAADDLARMVIQKMEEHEETRQIAETVAHEFKNSGIAFADSSGTCGTDCSTCSNGLRTTGIANCQATFALPGPCMGAVNSCVTNANAGCPDVNATAGDIAKFTQDYDKCVSDKGFPAATY